MFASRTYRVVLVGCFLAGCTAVPPLDPIRKISVAQIADRVQCELRNAVAPYASKGWLRAWHASYILTLQVDADAGVALSNSFINPVSDGTFTLGTGLGLSGSTTRIETMSFTLPIQKIRNYRCMLPPPPEFDLDGNLGLNDWVKRVAEAFDKHDKGEVESFGHSVSFVVAATASVTPNFALVRYTGPGAFSANRKDTHTLNVAFAPPDAKGKDKAGQTLQNQQFQLLLPQSPFRVR
jgi:hypothetical protein